MVMSAFIAEGRLKIPDIRKIQRNSLRGEHFLKLLSPYPCPQYIRGTFTFTLSSHFPLKICVKRKNSKMLNNCWKGALWIIRTWQKKKASYSEMECILLAVHVLSALQEEDLQWSLPSIDVHVLQSSRLHNYLLSGKLQAINFKKTKKNSNNLGVHNIYLDSWTKTSKVIFPELVEYKGQNKLEHLEETSKGNSFLGILGAKFQLRMKFN